MSRPFTLSALVLLAAQSAALCQERDEWQRITGDTAGFSHVVTEPVEQGGRKLWKTTNDLSMSINRFNTQIELNISATMLEDEAGVLVAMTQEMNTSASKSVTEVKVDGARAEVTRRISGPPQVQTIDWKKEWIGEYAKDRLVKAKLAAGASEFTYEQWLAEAGPAVATVKVLGRKTVDVPGGGSQELTQLRTSIDVQPGVVSDDYVDDKGETVMSVQKAMGMTIVAARATRAECLEAIKVKTPEIFAKISPVTNVRLPRPYHLDELVLSIKAADPDNPLPPLEDERQTITDKVSDREVVLRIRKLVPTQPFTLPLSNFTDAEKECLKPNLQVECDDPGIVALAKETVGGETDAWKAACKLERCAHDYITNKSMGSLFETAAGVFKSRSGDCTEHGVLLAALCRAVGIPSRVAVGLLYFRGIWGGHMWTEVSLGGKWYALDAVLGNGGVDAAHLRLAADSLANSQIERAFANVALGMTIKTNVLSYRHGDQRVVIGEDSADCSIEGDVYKHLLYGITLKAPEGYTFKPNRTIGLGEDEIVELDKPGAAAVEVSVTDVTSGFTLDEVKEMLNARGVSRVKATDRQIDGRPARVFRGKRNQQQEVVAAVIDDETLVLIGTKLGEGETDDALQAVLDAVDLDG
jgi:hypothetical protein